MVVVVTVADFLRGVAHELARSPGFLAVMLLAWLLLVTAIVFGVGP